MATRADIEVNVKGLKKVQELAKLLDKVSGKVDKLNQTGGSSKDKGNKVEKEAQKIQERKRALLVKNRNIGDQIQRGAEKGLKVQKASSALKRADAAVRRGEFTLAKAHQQVAIKELAIEKQITKENLAQLKAEQNKAKTAQSRSKRRRERIGQSALIGGGFPLLFGGSPLQALAGGLGGGLGELAAPGGGFAGSIAATAAVAAIQEFANSAREVGDALKDPTKALDALSDAGIQVDDAVKQQVQTLLDAGKEFEALEVVNRQVNESIGELAAKNLKDLDTSFDKLDEAAGKLFLKLKADLAPAFMTIIDLATKFVDSVGGRRIRRKAQELDLKAFREAESKIIKDLGGSFALTFSGELRDELTKRLTAASKDIINKTMPSFLAGGDSLTTTTGTGSSPSGGVVSDAQTFNTNTIIEKALEGHTKMVDKLKEENKLQERILELRRDGLNPSIAKTIAQLETESQIAKDNLQDEIDKLLNKQREIGILDDNDQKRLNAFKEQRDAMDGITHSTSNSVKEQMKLTNAATETLDAFQNINTAIQNDIKQGIAGLIKGTSTLSDLLNNVADKFLDIALNQGLFGNAGGKTITGGLFKMLGFADGGRPPVGRPSIVGEKGPELFVPRSSGNIIPNNKLGGGGNTSVVVNVDASGSDVQGDDAAAKELGSLISIAVQGELLRQQRPGGLLSR